MPILDAVSDCGFPAKPLCPPPSRCRRLQGTTTPGTVDLTALLPHATRPPQRRVEQCQQVTVASATPLSPAPGRGEEDALMLHRGSPANPKWPDSRGEGGPGIWGWWRCNRELNGSWSGSPDFGWKPSPGVEEGGDPARHLGTKDAASWVRASRCGNDRANAREGNGRKADKWWGKKIRESYEGRLEGGERKEAWGERGVSALKGRKAGVAWARGKQQREGLIKRPTVRGIRSGREALSAARLRWGWEVEDNRVGGGRPRTPSLSA